MRKIIFILLLLPSLAFGQTEDEKRAIMAAANKIKSDSSRLESRSTRIAEQRNQIEFLADAIAKAYRTIEIMDTLDNVRKEQIKTEVNLRVEAEKDRDKAVEDKEKADKRKKRWQKVSLILGVAITIETLILLI
jgi:hypothetical protein